MNKEFEQFLAKDNSPIAIDSFVLHFVVAAVLSYILSLLYIRFGKSLSNRKSFASNFVMITVTTMLIITIVKSSLALSLGLVGALSIVRYRTAIKEPEELSFLFFAISIGLGMGANQMIPTVIGFLLVTVCIILRTLQTKDQLFSTTLMIQDNSGNLNIEKCSEVISKFAKNIELRRASVKEQQFESIYFLEVPSLEELTKMINTFKENCPKVSIQYIENN